MQPAFGFFLLKRWRAKKFKGTENAPDLIVLLKADDSETGGWEAQWAWNRNSSERHMKSEARHMKTEARIEKSEARHMKSEVRHMKSEARHMNSEARHMNSEARIEKTEALIAEWKARVEKLEELLRVNTL